MTEEESYLFLQKGCGIKNGDKVRVISKAISYKHGWANDWCDGMDQAVGNVYEVQDTCINRYGVRLSFSRGWYSFPFFVLHKVDDGTEVAE